MFALSCFVWYFCSVYVTSFLLIILFCLGIDTVSYDIDTESVLKVLPVPKSAYHFFFQCEGGLARITEEGPMKVR